MPLSRSARNYLERKGIRRTRRKPIPRLDTGQLRVNTAPLEMSELNPAALLDAQGSPPPDRGKLDSWPPQQEVQDEPS
jgi:hypothetical protein